MDLKLNFLLDGTGIDPVPVPVARIEQREVSRELTPCWLLPLSLDFDFEAEWAFPFAASMKRGDMGEAGPFSTYSTFKGRFWNTVEAFAHTQITGHA